MSKQTKWTPGAWRIIRAAGALRIVDTSGFQVCEQSAETPEDLANFTLLEAAPDMAALLEQMLDATEDSDTQEVGGEPLEIARNEARSLLTRVKGK